MPVNLDDTDIAILKSLIQDGRKSFRAISREIKVSTPTVKAHYQRLVNMGVIKAVRAEIDTSKIVGPNKDKLKAVKIASIDMDHMQIKIKCEFCGGPIHDKPKMLRFANLERFFCCVSCRNSYKERYAGRIRSLVEQQKLSRRR